MKNSGRSLSENELSRIRIGLSCYADQLKDSGDIEVEAEWMALIALRDLFKRATNVIVVVAGGKRGQLA